MLIGEVKFNAKLTPHKLQANMTLLSSLVLVMLENLLELFKLVTLQIVIILREYLPKLIGYLHIKVEQMDMN